VVLYTPDCRLSRNREPRYSMPGSEAGKGCHGGRARAGRAGNCRSPGEWMERFWRDAAIRLLNDTTTYVGQEMEALNLPRFPGMGSVDTRRPEMMLRLSTEHGCRGCRMLGKDQRVGSRVGSRPAQSDMAEPEGYWMDATFTESWFQTAAHKGFRARYSHASERFSRSVPVDRAAWDGTGLTLDESGPRYRVCCQEIPGGCPCR